MRTHHTIGTVTRRVIADDGALLHVEDTGSPGARARGRPHAGLTVVFCHGFMLDRTAWHFQTEALAPFARVVLWDLRGHGRSGWGTSAPVSIDRLGRDLLTVLEATAPRGPVVLIGHSMGGMAIMALAAVHPEQFTSRVAAVGLLATSAGDLAAVRMGLSRPTAAVLHQVLVGGLPVLARAPAVVDPTRRWTGGLAFRLTHRMLCRTSMTPAARRITIHAMAGVPIRTVATFYPVLMSHDKHTALTALGHCPVLVAVGADDRITPPAHSLALATDIASAHLAVVPQAGHLLPLERPAQVNALLTDLVARGRTHVHEARWYA
ncbi:alpha/beta fold hydrolase [Streptomyces sp. E11-3]|uniref:alpha/beta fold hydrolase n=1 Tax=Streptomyces sp. E11-3 TaxID=3110112 RepID=UPI0039800E0C